MLTTLGMTFEIIEQDFRQMIMERMQRVDMVQAEQDIKDRVQKSAKSPKPVFVGNKRCKEYKTWLFDPTVTLERDVIDLKGNVLVKKGQVHNPLQNRSLKTQLVFIEGDDREQVTWSLNQGRSKIILVNGSPIEHEEQYQKPFFFDQGGHLCRKFSIAAFPARVFQEGDKLRCEEVVL